MSDVKIYVVLFEPAPGSIAGVGGFDWRPSREAAQKLYDQRIAENDELPESERYRVALYDAEIPAAWLEEPERVTEHVDDTLAWEVPPKPAILDTHPLIPVTVTSKRYVVESIAYTGEVPRELLANLDLDHIDPDDEGSALDQYICAHLTASEPMYETADEEDAVLVVTETGELATEVAEVTE